jgi:hypothetical protein
MMSNQEFIAAFTAGQLAPEGSGHRAHCAPPACCCNRAGKIGKPDRRGGMDG